MVFRQLFDPISSTYTYLLGASSGDAIIIDPVFEQVERDIALIRELGLNLTHSLETHVHADHITSASLLRERLGSKVVVSRAAGTTGADIEVEDGDTITFGDRSIHVRATPGHTNGCVTYVLDDKSRAFTGDALLIRGAGRTDFQEGSSESLYRSVHEQIFTLPQDCLLYPGHDYRGSTVTTVAEEKAFNPRLGGERSVTDFIGYMNNLGLAHPKKIDAAVPANKVCGASDQGKVGVPSWGPVVRTFAGVPEIDPRWVSENLASLAIIDVREQSEFDGELGHIEGARLLPLSQLRAEIDSISADTPAVLVCRSGGRSAQGAKILEGAGLERVASLTGGMIQWRASRLPVA